jgi:glycosyltransferase involved in cell wall biosynthesis
MARVVMFVLNDCRTDARVLREAETLGAAGHEVTIIARTTDPYSDAPETEELARFRIIRVPVARGALRLLLLGRRPRQLATALAASARRAVGAGPGGWVRLLLAAGLTAVLALPALLLAVPVGLVVLALTRVRALRPAWLSLEWRLQWAFGVEPWTQAATAAAPSADIFHAHDLRALPAAIGARDRSGGRLVYDSHEIFVEAGANAVRPRRAREALRRREQALAREADALVTVNDELAAVLGPALGLTDRTVVVRNCPPRWTPSAEPSPLRAAAGVADGVPLVLCHGAFVRHRGFEQVAAALERPELDGVHGVFLGRGSFRERLDELAASPRLGGRLRVLDAVHPDVLVDWIAGADVDVVAIQPTTLNHRLSTPNKLFESLAAGVPVVASDFPAMRGIVIDDADGPLGAVCDPSDPAALAAAVRSVLKQTPGEMADLRLRCLDAAHKRWNWEIEGSRLLALYAALAAGAPAPGPAPARAA